MYDSHTHLNNPHLAQDIPALLMRFAEVGGKGILNVAYSFETIEEVLNTAKEYYHVEGLEIKTAIGLHPELFYSNSEFDRPLVTVNSVTTALKTLETIITSNTTYVNAIGEIGLDYYRLSEDPTLTLEQKNDQKELQRLAFRKQLELAMKYHLPVTIHTRDTKDSVQVFEDAVKLVAEVGKGSISGSFHSFTGPVRFVGQITDLGLYVGFNGIITYASGDNIRDNLLATPLDKILFETDAPYLPPREKRKLISKGGYGFCEPADVKEVVETASKLLNISEAELLRAINENYLRMFENSEPR